MGIGSGGFWMARDMMREMSASLRNVRHGHDGTTEMIMVLGVYALLAMGGLVSTCIGAGVVAIWLAAHIRQDHCFSLRPWKLFAAVTLGVFLLVLAGVYLGAVWLIFGVAPESYDLQRSRHVIAALVAIGPALAAYVLMRRLRRKELEEGLEAWLDDEEEIEVACPKAVARRRRLVDRIIIGVCIAIVVGVIGSGGLWPFWTELTFSRGMMRDLLPALLLGLFTLGPLAIVLVVGTAIRQVQAARDRRAERRAA